MAVGAGLGAGAGLGDGGGEEETGAVGTVEPAPCAEATTDSGATQARTTARGR